MAEGFKTQQTALLHSRRLYDRKLYYTAEGFNAQQTTSNAQQKALLHNRKLYCIAESFAKKQKSQSCGRNWRKVPFAAEKFLLRQK